MFLTAVLIVRAGEDIHCGLIRVVMIVVKIVLFLYHELLYNLVVICCIKAKLSLSSVGLNVAKMPHEIVMSAELLVMFVHSKILPSENIRYT